jgi:hypothetical protein
LLLVVAACDLQPPKKKAAPPPPPPPKVMVDAGVAPVVSADAGAPADAPSVADGATVTVTADGDIEPTQECLDVAVHVADTLIAVEKDASKKASLEQDKANMVKVMSRRCTKGSWPELSRKCLLAAKTQLQIEQCARTVPQPND